MLISIGLLCVYFGYRLFCSISRRTLSTLAGASLAIFGMAILVGEAKDFAHRNRSGGPAVHHSPNWHNGAAPSTHTQSSFDRIA